VTQKTNLLRRVTIADIALRAGVSKGAVSYALNGRPGISEVTRQRILKIADDLGWYPNSAARALSGARAGACGLVLARPARTLAFETFFMELIAGIEMELSSRSVGLTLQVVHDLEPKWRLRRWWRAAPSTVCSWSTRASMTEDRADREARAPGRHHCGPEGTGNLSAVWSDDAGAVVDVVRYLARLGHQRIARVAGVPEFLSTEARTEAYLATMRNCRYPESRHDRLHGRERRQVTRQRSRTARSNGDHLRQRGACRRRLGAAHEMGSGPT